MRSGQRIPMEIEPGEPLQVPSQRQLSMLLTLANALLQGKILRSTRDGFHIADENAVFELKDDFSAANAELVPFRINLPNQGTASFRDITVNNGYLAFQGTTHGNRIPSGPLMNGTNDPVSLTVDAAALVYVYLFYNGSNWEITSDSTDDATWVTFGINDNKHIIIGTIDATTNAGDNELILIQTYEGNLYMPLNGTVNGIDYRKVLVLGTAGGGDEIPFYTMVRGLAINGFPADGLFLYIGNGTGVGPGNNYSVLATD